MFKDFWKVSLHRADHRILSLKGKAPSRVGKFEDTGFFFLKKGCLESSEGSGENR